MVNAIVLMQVQRSGINETAQKLAEVEGVSEVFSVGGRYDLVAILRTRNNEEMAELVTQRLVDMDAIVDTETLIAFRAYSRHDLERMFSIGAEGE